MKIARSMSLGELAERMGSDATPENAAAMRDALLETEYTDTEDMPDDEWLSILDNVC